jgi:hypothetical protein
MRAGAPYLEPHHIRRLTDGVPDDLLVGSSSPFSWRTQSMSNASQQQNSLLTGKLTGKSEK